MHAGKAKRKLGVQRRAIPFLSFYSVVQEADRRGGHTKRFDLRVVSGRVFQFECRNVEECDEWVKHILVRGGPATSSTLCGCKFVLRRVTGWVAGWLGVGWLVAGGHRRACCSSLSQSVLPRDNVAAVKIQSVVRMHFAKKVRLGWLRNVATARVAGVGGGYPCCRLQCRHPARSALGTGCCKEEARA